MKMTFGDDIRFVEGLPSSEDVDNVSVTFHGIYSFPRDSFIVNISMHFWATLDMTCSGSQGDLVSPVRGARDAPPMKSVSYQAVCAVISVSSDVLWMRT